MDYTASASHYFVPYVQITSLVPVVPDVVNVNAAEVYHIKTRLLCFVCTSIGLLHCVYRRL